MQETVAGRARASRAFRLRTVPDDFHREGLGIEVDISLPAERLIPIVGKTIPQIVFRPSSDLDRIIAWRGKPFTIRVDNGPEYIRETLMK